MLTSTESKFLYVFIYPFSILQLNIGKTQKLVVLKKNLEPGAILYCIKTCYNLIIGAL